MITKRFPEGGLAFFLFQRFEEQKGGFMRPPKLALFDSRVFTIPLPVEVKNYFLWRQQDCVRNSISSAAQSMYSHSELNGKDTNSMQEMMFQKGTNWNNYSSCLKRGRIVVKKEVIVPTENGGARRNKWIIDTCEMFSCEEGTVLDEILKLK